MHKKLELLASCYLGIVPCRLIARAHTLISTSAWGEIYLKMRLPSGSISTDFKSTAIRQVPCFHSLRLRFILAFLSGLIFYSHFLGLIFQQKPLVRQTSVRSNSGITHHAPTSWTCTADICACFSRWGGLLPELVLILIQIWLELKH